MLTGKDIHRTFQRQEPAVKPWEEIHVNARKTYEAVAEKLNASHIAPLQGQVAGLEAQNEKLTTDIKALRDLDRKIFDDQENTIDALKGLVRDYHAEIAIALATGAKPGDQRLQEIQERTGVLLAAKES